MGKDVYHYVHSCDLEQRVKVRIGSLQGKLPEKDFHALLTDPLQPFRREQLVYVSLEIFDDGDSLTLPVFTRPVSVLNNSSRNTLNWNEWLQLPIEYCELSREAVIAVRLIDFAEKKCLGSSTFTLFDELGEFHHGGRDICIWPNRHPDPSYYCSDTPATGRQDSTHQMPWLQPIVDQYNRSQLPKVDWLDKLTFREIEQINEKEKQSGDLLHLLIETQRIYKSDTDYALIYFENGSDQKIEKTINHKIKHIIDFTDSENLVENAQLRLARSIGRLMTEKKPSPAERDQLKKIIQIGLKPEDKESGSLVYRFRSYLSSDMAALIPFLISVRWTVADEHSDALIMLQEWTPISAALALSLLGSDGPCREAEVRRYAIRRLQAAPADELKMFLLQLVQALKYENIQDNEMNNQSTSQMLEESCRDDLYTANSGLLSSRTISNQIDALALFLLNVSIKYPELTSYLYWYIKVEDEYSKSIHDKDFKQLYKYDYKKFIVAFNKHLLDNECQQLRSHLIRQDRLMTALVDNIRAVQKYGNRWERLEQFKALLEEEVEYEFGTFTNMKPTLFMLDPTKSMVGINTEKTYMFKSAMMPALLYFRMSDGSEFPAIVKVGDDLRQDQLVLQMISLMNRLLLEEKLDLCLTPYSVLATSIDAGLMEFVPSAVLGDILRSGSTIGKHLEEKCEGNNVKENYIRSCAGYCVITYILGIGDRHNDNLLLTKEGKLFHIDFGFILGRDPKAMPPPMKLSREMVEPMGPEGWNQFKTYCYEAFINLRRHSQLILSLFALMLNAGIPDIAIEPDKTLHKVKDKLKLELDDEEAVKHMQSVIDQSVTSFMARVAEFQHSIAQWAKS